MVIFLTRFSLKSYHTRDKRSSVVRVEKRSCYAEIVAVGSSVLNQNEFRIATVAMFTCDLYPGSPPPHDLERLRTTMQRRVVDFVRVGYFIPLNGPLNGHPPSNLLSVCRMHNFVLFLFQAAAVLNCLS